MLLLHSVQLSLDFRMGEFLESEEVRKEFAERWHALLKYKMRPVERTEGIRTRS